MLVPSDEIIAGLRKLFPKGCRVELIRMDDPQAPPIGTKGTVTHVDDIGTIHVAWDNGSSLGVVYSEDECRRAADTEKQKKKIHCLVVKSFPLLVAQRPTMNLQEKCIIFGNIQPWQGLDKRMYTFGTASASADVSATMNTGRQEMLSKV